MLTLSFKTLTLPITLQELKDHLRVDDTSEDAQIESLAWAAVGLIEGETGKDFTSTTWVEVGQFPDYWQKIELAKQPVTAVSSITYYDTANALQTLSTSKYHVMLPHSGVAWVEPTYSTSWPETYTRPDAVSITYTTGWTVCPDTFKQCVKLIVAEWYETRVSQVPGNLATLSLGVQRLIDLLSVWVVR